MKSRLMLLLAAQILAWGWAGSAFAQLVILPAPRLLTTMPMGGQAGTTFPVTVTGECLDGNVELVFTHPGIKAVPEKNADGSIVPNKFQVTIAAETPTAVYEARLTTRLGISASRTFSVSNLTEVTREKANTSLATAMALPLNSVCNAYTSNKAIDYYTFHCDQPQRVTVEVAAAGIDSKLKPVLMIADPQGRDLAVDRRGGFLDYQIPKAGDYVIKVHGLTFQGGAESFYRLVLKTAPGTALAERHPRTQQVNAISLPPEPQTTPVQESEPNNRANVSQKITLPCDIAGSFFPAADVDTFEFTAEKGEVWWLEVVSERTGLPTNAFAVVQQVVKQGDTEVAVDLVELNDVPSPVKLSSNGYSYDGSPYDVGTADPMGKVEIKESGTYRVQVRDLFGGTRSDPRCTYRLIMRKAMPDYSLAAWALHMTLRNGDRNAVSKPIALRQGASMVFEVVAVRKDGFDEEITIEVENLPAGVRASGLKIPSGKSRGLLVITADENAPTQWGTPTIIGRSTIDAVPQIRECRLASMNWPVRDANQEIPSPRLMGDVAVSVTGEEAAPLTIAPVDNKTITAVGNEKLTIPLKLTWRGEFSGALKLLPGGNGFEKVASIDVPLNSPSIDLVVNLEDLKLPAGEHVLTMYGGAVTKYRYNVAAVETATASLKSVEAELKEKTDLSTTATAAAQAAAEADKAALTEKATAAAAELKQVQTKKAELEKQLKAATDAAAPKDIVDIVVVEPIRILIQPADKK